MNGGGLFSFFHLIQFFEIVFLLILQGIRSLYGNTVVIIAPGLDILERLWLSLLTFIYFGCYMLKLLWDKLADETYLDLFGVLTVSSFSFILEALYLTNDLDSFNDILLFDSFQIDLYFLLWEVCLFCLWCQFYFSLPWVMSFFTTLGFVSISLIPFLTIFYVVCTNSFLEDIILVLDIFLLVCYKTKVILSVNFNMFIALYHNSLLSAMKVQLFKAFYSKTVVSHKPKPYQIFRSWTP